MYKAEILADSLSPQGDRLTTMKITFPRFILAEFNTHRMFSRNSASSRAIPFNKMLKMVEENPFIPIAWQKDHKGMQGTEYITDENIIKRNINIWKTCLNENIYRAKVLNSECEVTKQLCNRLLEPFMWHTVIITSGEEGLENFFKLRCPEIYHPATEKYYRSLKDWNNVDKEIQWNDLSCLHPENKSQAEIHIQAIAELMWDNYNASIPKQLQAGEWHIPFGDNLDFDMLASNYGENVAYDMMIKIATARCARISYETLGDNPKIDYEADLKLHDRLLAEYHASPMEHCARAMTYDEYNLGFTHRKGEYEELGWCRNFRGFIQYRAFIDI